MPKRVNEETDDISSSDISHKRQKIDEDVDDIKDKIATALITAENILEGINNDSKPDKISKRFVLVTLTGLFNCSGEEEASERIKVVQDYIQDYIQDNLSSITKVAKRKPIEMCLQSVIEYLPVSQSYVCAGTIVLIRILEKFKHALYKRAPPSTFANEKDWPAQQNRPGAILCLRPVEKRGLPVYLLHRAFLVFRTQCRQPLPDSPEAAEAMRTATLLCSRMGNAFSTKDARSLAFNDAVRAFFSNWQPEVKVNINDGTVSGQVDRALRSRRSGGIMLVLGEDKLEFDTGDPYMQVSRSYDLKSVQDRQHHPEYVSRGAPAFLTTLAGVYLNIDALHT
jgi:hypothetical protein